MSKNIAIEDASIQALLNDPSGTASYTIQSGLSTKTKVLSKAVLLDGTKVLVSGLSVPGSQIDPVTFTFQSTAEKTTFDTKSPLLEGDKTAKANVRFRVGSQIQNQQVELTLVQAGQLKVLGN